MRVCVLQVWQWVGFDVTGEHLASLPNTIKPVVTVQPHSLQHLTDLLLHMLLLTYFILAQAYLF